MMRGPKAMCIAVRRRTAASRQRGDTRCDKDHGRNGPSCAASTTWQKTLAVGYRCLMRSADISMTEEEKEQDDSKFDRWVQQHLGEKASLC